MFLNFRKNMMHGIKTTTRNGGNEKPCWGIKSCANFTQVLLKIKELTEFTVPIELCSSH